MEEIAMAEDWTSSLARDVMPLLRQMNEAVDRLAADRKDGDLVAAWATMQDLGRTGEQAHTALQPYVTGALPSAMPETSYEALADVCWASHTWFTAVQEVESVINDAELSGDIYETNELVERIDECVAAWQTAWPKLAELDAAGG
jgi:hypothetical protein